MDEVIAVIACAGAWLLFAGPLLQAALELRDETRRQRILLPAEVRPHGASPWWWVLPPVAVWLHRSERKRFRQQQLASMSADDIRENLVFSDRATGWLLVATGALLIGVKETWEAGAAFDAPEYLRWIAIVAVPALTAAVAALHMASTGKLLLHGAPGGGRRGALRAERSAEAESPADQ